MAWIHTGISCMAQKHFVYGSPEHNRNEENLTINELTGANFHYRSNFKDLPEWLKGSLNQSLGGGMHRTPCVNWLANGLISRERE